MTGMSRWIQLALLDLRGIGRFGVLLAAIALGVGTIAAVGSVGAGLNGTIARDAQLLLGGDMEIRQAERSATPEERQLFDTLGTVSEVFDVNTQAISDDGAAFVALRGVDERYPLLGSVTLQDGSAADVATLTAYDEDSMTWGAIVSPQLLDSLDIQLGDEFSVGAEGFVAKALLDRMPDQVASGMVIGLPLLVSTTAVESAGLKEPGMFGMFRYKVLLNADEGFEAARETVRTGLPGAGWQVRSPNQAADNLSQFIDLFTRFLTLIGLTTLWVGGVGVSNAVNAYVGDRQRDIATLRSLGATSARVFVHLMTQIMVLSVIGTVLGMILGAVASIIALPILGNLIAITLEPQVDPASLVSAAGFGLLIAFGFALIPLGRAQFIRPALLFRSANGGVDMPGRFSDITRPGIMVPLLVTGVLLFALASWTTKSPILVAWYALGAAGAFLVLRLAAEILQRGMRLVPQPIRLPVRLAVRGISRPGAATPLILLSMGLGLTLLLLIALTESAVRNELLGQIRTDAPSIVMIDVTPEQTRAVQAYAATDPRITEVQTTAMLRGNWVSIDGKTIEEMQPIPQEAAMLVERDVPVSWADSLPDGSNLVAGEWWPADYDGPPLVSLAEEMHQFMNMQVGETITMSLSGSTPITATIANFRHIDWANAQLNFGVLFSPGAADESRATYLNLIQSAKEDEKALTRDLALQFPDVALIGVGSTLEQVSELLGSVANAVRLIGGVAVVSGILVLAGALSAGRRQREAEAVVMKVLGATRGDVVAAYLVEYGMLGALATLLAAGLGIAGAWAVVGLALELPFGLDFGLVVTVLAGAMIAAIATGLVVTWSALSSRPARFLRSVG